MYRFEKLQVWQKAMNFCKLVYKKTNDFPDEERFGLISQFRRAATSIPLNIAEGSACRTNNEFIQFLTIALRSQYECVTIIKLAYDLGFLNKSDYKTLEDKVAEIGRLTQALINSIKRKSKNQKPTTNNCN
jgi:four helix bundle protein